MSRQGFGGYDVYYGGWSNPRGQSAYDYGYGYGYGGYYPSGLEFGRGPAGAWGYGPDYPRPYERYAGGWPIRAPDDLYGAPYDYGDLYVEGSFAESGWGGPTGSWQPGIRAGGAVDVADEYGLADADLVRAEEIMTDDPEVVLPNTSLADVARRMKELDVGIMPVVSDEEERRLEGVVTDRDLAIRALAEGKDGKAKVKSVMTREVETVSPSATMHDVMDTMKRAQVRRVPVVDGDGRLVGIIAQADLAVQYAGLDLDREVEVEEVVERVSEPARPRRREALARARQRLTNQPVSYRYDRGLGERLRGNVRAGWRRIEHTARDWIGRGYDRGY